MTTMMTHETRLALIHRVLVPDRDYPKEYAILVTDLSSIFVRQEKTRSNWVLRQEMKFGTALVIDRVPKILDDFEQTSLETLSSDSGNVSIPHKAVISLAMTADPLERRKRDFFVWMVMNRQREVFQVYNFEMKYNRDPHHEAMVKFYAVPLGMYFKPRRQTQTRETILRDYATDILEVYRGVLPASALPSSNGAIAVSSPSD